jgi:hypothetical protein
MKENSLSLAYYPLGCSVGVARTELGKFIGIEFGLNPEETGIHCYAIPLEHAKSLAEDILKMVKQQEN